MDADKLKKKLETQNPLMLSPMPCVLAACGGGGDVEGKGEQNETSRNSNPPSAKQ